MYKHWPYVVSVLNIKIKQGIIEWWIVLPLIEVVLLINKFIKIYQDYHNKTQPINY